MSTLNAKVFDLIAAERGNTVVELRQMLWPLDPNSVKKALNRLRIAGVLDMEHAYAEYVYRVRPGAQRPVDGPGGRKRLEYSPATPRSERSG